MTSSEHADISRQSGMALRTSLQVAMQVADQLARRREHRLRAAAAANEQQARAFQARLRAERRSVEARLHSARRDTWWSTATDAQITETARVAHTWKNDSPIAADIVDELPDRLRRHRKIDLSIPDAAEAALVAAIIERDLAARAEYERVTEEFAGRGHEVRTETPHGVDYIPARYLATAADAEFCRDTVDADTIAANPGAWVVHVRSGPDGQPDPQFYCTDPDAAGVYRRPPERPDLWDEQWLDSASEPQLRTLRDSLATSNTTAGIDRLDEQILDRRGIDLTRPPDEIGHDIATALPWAQKNIPADVTRYDKGDAKAKAAAETNIRTAFDTHHAQQWANAQAPALAVEFGAASNSPDRDKYIGVRDRMIEEWNSAGRPAAPTQQALEPAAPDGATSEPGYDTPARRARDAQTLTGAGVDEETVDAHTLADTANASPVDAAATQPPRTAPVAKKGDRGPNVDITADRGGR